MATSEGVDTNAHSGVVCDWVAVFTRHVTEPDTTTAWPEVGVVGSTRFRKGRQVLFDVLCAAEPDHGPSRRQVVRMACVPGENTAAWTAFFRSLTGAPTYIVADGAPAIVIAITHIDTRPDNVPRSSGAVEEVLHQVRLRLKDRATRFRNRDRTNRLLPCSPPNTTATSTRSPGRTGYATT